MLQTSTGKVGDYVWRRYRGDGMMMDTLEIPVHELPLLGIPFRVEEWRAKEKPQVITLAGRTYHRTRGEITKGVEYGV